MKKFNYPLSKLRQVRDIEVSIASDALREVNRQIAKVETAIEEHRTAILACHSKLVETETRTRKISPELRTATMRYVDLIQEELETLQQRLAELHKQCDELHAQLVGKKQSVKMLDNHEKRLATAHEYMVSNALQKESDDLWLTRSAGRTESMK